MLTDRHRVSACEDFVAAMRISHRATILGETTEGSTGQPYSVEFPELKMAFRVSTRREYYPDGSPFEGIGVRPDVDIPLTRAMLMDKEDAVLERALTIIRRSNHRSLEKRFTVPNGSRVVMSASRLRRQITDHLLPPPIGRLVERIGTCVFSASCTK